MYGWQISEPIDRSHSVTKVQCLNHKRSVVNIPLTCGITWEGDENVKVEKRFREKMEQRTERTTASPAFFWTVLESGVCLWKSEKYVWEEKTTARHEKLQLMESSEWMRWPYFVMSKNNHELICGSSVVPLFCHLEILKGQVIVKNLSKKEWSTFTKYLCKGVKLGAPQPHKELLWETKWCAPCISLQGREMNRGKRELGSNKLLKLERWWAALGVLLHFPFLPGYW